MDDEYSKVNMVDQLSIAVSSPKNYKHLTKLKTSKTVWFVVLLTFILVFIEYGISLIAFLMHVGGLDNLINNKITEFVYENGKLTAENEMALDINNATVYINTDYDEISMSDIDIDGVYVAFGAKNMVMGIVSGTQTYEYAEMDLADILPDGFDNDMLSSMIPFFYVSFIFVYLFSMVGDAVKIIIYALIFSIIGRVIANNANSGLSYGNILRVCIYGQTLSMLLTAINTCLGYFISSSLMFIIGIIISFVYINRAIGGHARNIDAPPDDWL